MNIFSTYIILIFLWHNLKMILVRLWRSKGVTTTPLKREDPVTNLSGLAT